MCSTWSSQPLYIFLLPIGGSSTICSGPGTPLFTGKPAKIKSSQSKPILTHSTCVLAQVTTSRNNKILWTSPVLQKLHIHCSFGRQSSLQWGKPSYCKGSFSLDVFSRMFSPTQCKDVGTTSREITSQESATYFADCSVNCAPSLGFSPGSPPQERSLPCTTEQEVMISATGVSHQLNLGESNLYQLRIFPVRKLRSEWRKKER